MEYSSDYHIAVTPEFFNPTVTTEFGKRLRDKTSGYHSLWELHNGKPAVKYHFIKAPHVLKIHTASMTLAKHPAWVVLKDGLHGVNHYVDYDHKMHPEFHRLKNFETNEYHPEKVTFHIEPATSLQKPRQTTPRAYSLQVNKDLKNIMSAPRIGL